MTKQRFSILFLILFLLPFLSWGQFRHSAKLAAVNETGFYRINISPDLSSYLRPDLADIRIVDGKNQTVPFIIKTAGQGKTADPVYDKQIIISNHTGDSATSLLIGNESRKELSNIAIELKSASAERTASLRGSNDKWDWFVVLDNVLVSNPIDNAKPTYFQYIKFPPSNYKYFMLDIHNGAKAPLNITNAYTVSSLPAEVDTDHYIDNPKTRFTQVDLGLYSVLTIYPGSKFHIHQIKLIEGGPYLFHRTAKIYSMVDSNIQRTWLGAPLHSFTLTSDDPGGESIPVMQADSFYVVIENGDNPPLRIRDVTTAQVKRSIIAPLEKGVSYQLLLNDPLASAPKYDLEEFKSRIPSALPNIEVLSINKLPSVVNTATVKKIEKWWIWPVLIAVIAILCLLAWRLTTDMRKNPK
jgi:hypothetical protein